jgi:cysteinyl-tRNA synthetase
VWLHHGFIEVNREKMSKSLGNFFNVNECFRVVEPEALRYFMLTTHYRSPLSVDWAENAAGELTHFPQIEECERRVEYLYTTLLRVSGFPDARIDPRDTRVDADLAGFRKRVTEALDDDLNMPVALAALAELLKRVNKLGAATKRAIADNFAFAGRVLGLGLDQPPAFLERVRARRLHTLGLREGDVEQKIEERVAARKAKDFARADAIRDELLALGIELMDDGQRTTWRVA